MDRETLKRYLYQLIRQDSGAVVSPEELDAMADRYLQGGSTEGWSPSIKGLLEAESGARIPDEEWKMAHEKARRFTPGMGMTGWGEGEESLMNMRRLLQDKLKELNRMIFGK